MLSCARHIAVEGHEVTPLDGLWQAVATDPGAVTDADALGPGLEWQEIEIPGNPPGAGDDRDWWFRRRFEAGAAAAEEEVVLELDGIATVAEVYVNGRKVLESESMFAASAVDVGALLTGDNQLAICVRALDPLVAISRRPRARWRTRLVSSGGLRFFRTMLLGRAPGFAPGPPLVGPWRPLRLVRRRGVALAGLTLRPRLEPDGAGVLVIEAEIRSLSGASAERVDAVLEGPNGTHRTTLEPGDGGGVRGQLVVDGVVRWWPHTHGDPALHAVSLQVTLGGGGELAIDCGRVGFRELRGGERLEEEGIQLRVNGVAVFARGALWTPLEAGGSRATPAELRATLETVCSGGLNMLRIPGTAAYESAAFHDLCDELGILVWQDFMFANMDYPEGDQQFMAAVEREVGQLLDEVGGRPSLAVLCGSSEIAQQVAMLGLDPELASGPLFGRLLPGLAAQSGLDAIYVASAPSGPGLPFRPARGVANYYGVGGYRRPIEDARRAEVKFAAECLAFANVPDSVALEAIAPGLVVHDPRWKAGVPRDVGSGWDFDDVRDHYLGTLFGVEASTLRWSDHERYLELSRAVSGEVMAEVFGEWRRAGSPCGGGLVLWLRDLLPGAGWGLLDSGGRPKVAFHHLRRVLAPSAVWTTDEGLGGIVAHVAHDGPTALRARLRIALYRDLETPVAEATRALELAPHSACEYDIEDLIGHFVDAAWAYRFGPPPHDVVAVSLEAERDGGIELLSQAFRLPAGPPLEREPASRLGLRAHMLAARGEHALVTVTSTRLAYGVRVDVPGFRMSDDAFSIEPGGQRQIDCTRIGDGPAATAGTLTALNMAGRVAVTVAVGERG